MPKSHVYAGRSPDHATSHLYAPGGLGVLGALVPTTGEGGRTGLLANDVAANNWQDVEVRCHVVASNFPQLIIYPDSSYLAGGLADSLYQATLRVYANGQDEGTSLFELLVGGETIITTLEVQDTGAEEVVCNVDIAAAPETIAVTAVVEDQGVEQVQCVVNIFDAAQAVPTLSATGARRIKAGAKTPTKLNPIDVAEVDDLVMLFTPPLDPADPIVTVQMTSEARVGTDAQPQPLLSGAYQVHSSDQGHTVLQRIQGASGVAGVTYLIRGTAVTVGGRKATASAFIKVLRKL